MCKKCDTLVAEGKDISDVLSEIAKTCLPTCLNRYTKQELKNVFDDMFPSYLFDCSIYDRLDIIKYIIINLKIKMHMSLERLYSIATQLDKHINFEIFDFLIVNNEYSNRKVSIVLLLTFINEFNFLLYYLSDVFLFLSLSSI